MQREILLEKNAGFTRLDERLISAVELQSSTNVGNQCRRKIHFSEIHGFRRELISLKTQRRQCMQLLCEVPRVSCGEVDIECLPTTVGDTPVSIGDADTGVIEILWKCLILAVKETVVPNHTSQDQFVYGHPVRKQRTGEMIHAADRLDGIDSDAVGECVGAKSPGVNGTGEQCVAQRSKDIVVILWATNIIEGVVGAIEPSMEEITSYYNQ